MAYIGLQNLGAVLVVFAWGALLVSGCSLPGNYRSEQPKEAVFYTPAASGSDALYNPLYSNVSYSLDTLQLAKNFSTNSFNENLENVWYHLQHPRTTIEEDGGTTRFINREVFPIDSDRFNESAAMLPNYMLHLLGGGNLYRKDLEWLRAHDYRYPRLAAATLAMVSELLQEAIENEDTSDSDAIADFYLFRPIGLLLFSSESVARYIDRVLEPAVWSTLQSWDATKGDFTNTGIAYVYRPPMFMYGEYRGFVYTGLNTLFGLSRTLQSGATLSWGLGVSVGEITDQKNVRANLKTSSGLFYDRNNSLIWSAVVNDAGDTKFRVNLYPYGKSIPGRAGFFFVVNDDDKISAGIAYSLPLGIGVSN